MIDSNRKLTWADLKSQSTSKQLLIQFTDQTSYYYVFIIENDSQLYTNISKTTPANADQTDFETNYQPNANKKIFDRIIFDQPGQNVDFSSNLKAVSPIKKFEARFDLSAQTLLFEQQVATAGTITGPTAQEALVVLNTTTASGSSAILASIRQFRYESGYTHRVEMSVAPKTTDINCTKRWGYLAGFNGLFFQLTDGTLSVGRRTGTSGVAVDTLVAQSSWNIDKLDGTGSSGITLNMNNFNVWFIEFGWHGASLVRFGVVVNGVNKYCHELTLSNANTTTYMKSASLPIRFEMTNTGVTSLAQSMSIASTVFLVYGPTTTTPFSFSTSNGITTRAIVTATFLPVLAIRPKATFGVNTNRSVTTPTDVSIFSTGTAYWEARLNPTTLTGGAWVSVSTDSMIESNVTATAVTGGRVVASGYVNITGNQADGTNIGKILNDIFLTVRTLSGTQDILVMCVRTFTGGGECSTGIVWTEDY